MSAKRKPKKLSETLYQGYMRIRLKTNMPVDELCKLAEFTEDWKIQRRNITKNPRYFGVDIQLFATNGLRAYNNFHVTDKVGLQGINQAIISALKELIDYAMNNGIEIDHNASYIQIKHIRNPNTKPAKSA